MSLERVPDRDPGIHTHDLPEPDEHFCSCCRKGIIANVHNVVRINKQPEGIYDLKGNLLGVEGVERPKAFFHAECFQDNHLPSKKVVQCKYCGALSMVKTFPDGTKNGCMCSCHKDGRFCSLIIL